MFVGNLGLHAMTEIYVPESKTFVGPDILASKIGEQIKLVITKTDYEIPLSIKSIK